MGAEAKNAGLSTRSKRLVVWSIVGITILVVALLGVVIYVTSMARKPSVEIISKNSSGEYQGTNYIVHVDATIFNRGADTTVTVFAKVREQTQFQTIWLGSNQAKTLSFTFSLSAESVMVYSVDVWAM